MFKQLGATRELRMTNSARSWIGPPLPTRFAERYVARVITIELTPPFRPP